MTLAATRPHARRVSRLVTIPVLSALVLVFGWGALWLFARFEAETVMDRLVAREAARGRVWSCPDRRVGGFPFRIEVACTEPSFQGRLGDADVKASLAAIRARTYLYEPSAVEADLFGPLRVESGEPRLKGAASWGSMRLVLRGVTAELKRAALVVERPEVAFADGAQGRAEALEVHLAPALGRDADDLRIVLARAVVPTADALAGSADPIDAEVEAMITQVAAAGAEPDLGTVERWREAGGVVDLARLSLAKGALALDGAGTLRLDEEHRPAGRLEATLSGFGPLAARIGLPARALEVGGVLAHLLGRGASSSKPDGVTGTGVTLPVVLAEGRVSVGPFRTALTLAPLY